MSNDFWTVTLTYSDGYSIKFTSDHFLWMFWDILEVHKEQNHGELVKIEAV